MSRQLGRFAIILHVVAPIGLALASIYISTSGIMFKMKKYLALIAFILVSGCASTPATVTFNGETVGTYGASAGCGTLMLDSDCSQMSGSTREIEINGIPLRIAGGKEGKIIFVMSMPKFMPDDKALTRGSLAIERLLKSKNVRIESTKVMFGSGKVFGVHYTLDSDGYSYLKELSI